MVDKPGEGLCRMNYEYSVEFARRMFLSGLVLIFGITRNRIFLSPRPIVRDLTEDRGVA